jgi:hypothetical protein
MQTASMCLYTNMQRCWHLLLQQCVKSIVLSSGLYIVLHGSCTSLAYLVLFKAFPDIAHTCTGRQRHATVSSDAHPCNAL